MMCLMYLVMGSWFSEICYKVTVACVLHCCIKFSYCRSFLRLWRSINSLRSGSSNWHMIGMSMANHWCKTVPRLKCERSMQGQYLCGRWACSIGMQWNIMCDTICTDSALTFCTGSGKADEAFSWIMWFLCFEVWWCHISFADDSNVSPCMFMWRTFGMCLTQVYMGNISTHSGITRHLLLRQASLWTA